ncbi:MAG: tetratricopeptide repeat protein [Paludibacteraceae bacterium]|nr:tetratricopeptide repeat protein [Paludibacteraceae bacterium]
MRLFFLIIAYFLLSAVRLVAAPNRFQELADELFSSGNKEKAFRTYGDAIRADSPEDHNYELYINAGDCAYLLNYKQIALSYYAISAQKEAPSNLLIKHIDNVYCNGDIGCIANTIKQIMAKYPETSDSLSIAIAKFLYSKARYEEASPILKELLRKDSSNVYLKSTLADAMLHSNNNDSAKVLYQEIIDADPDNIEASLFLGNYYFLIAQESKKVMGDDLSDEKQAKIIGYYEKAAFFLEKVYATKRSNVIKEKLSEAYSYSKGKEKLNSFK